MALTEIAKWCIVLLLTMHVFSDFYFLHGDGQVAITEFVFHCVNLRSTGDVSMCSGGGEDNLIFFFHNGGGGGSD